MCFLVPLERSANCIVCSPAAFTVVCTVWPWMPTMSTGWKWPWDKSGEHLDHTHKMLRDAVKRDFEHHSQSSQDPWLRSRFCHHRCHYFLTGVQDEEGTAAAVSRSIPPSISRSPSHSQHSFPPFWPWVRCLGKRDMCWMVDSWFRAKVTMRQAGHWGFLESSVDPGVRWLRFPASSATWTWENGAPCLELSFFTLR